MWITLTESEMQRQAIVNFAHALYMKDCVSAAFGHLGTCLTFEKGSAIYVKEAQEQILALIRSSN